MRAYCLLFVRAPGEQEINNLPWIRTRVRAHIYADRRITRSFARVIVSLQNGTGRGKGERKKKKESRTVTGTV